VVHDGHAPYCRRRLIASTRHRRSRGHRVILVSNSPRSTIGVTRQLDEIGVAREAYDTAVTSGDVTRDLMQQTDGRLFHLGPSARPFHL
jgi:ribonucleotide monophosphatase NagD (HAD superfamily)